MISLFTILPKNLKIPKEMGHLQTHEQAASKQDPRLHQCRILSKEITHISS